MKFADVTLADVKEAIKAAIKAGCAATLVHNGANVALMAWEETAEGEALATTFLATDRFYEPDVPSVRFGRRYMRQIQAEAGNLPVVSYCYSPHPKVERWYRLMGYRLIKVEGPCKVFVLPAR
ncbi:hypothetical protein [Aureimonas flava]|uniref:hypothetical protein n=1 Tax=Aureimonas flava TaxID=2320271 RepID=UPI0010A9549E|nr:hypothetical protein [Aureimonas flava]